MKKKTMQVAAIATVLSSMAISPLFAFADENEKEKAGKTYQSNGVVKLIEGSGSTGPVDPTNPNPGETVDPEPSPEPGTGGPLGIDFVSNLDFGVNEIASKDITYYANAQKLLVGGESKFVPNYAQISDNRGTNAGWALTVKQEGQFSNDAATTQNKKLEGAQIKFDKPTVTSNTVTKNPPTASKEIILVPEGAESLVMSAKPTQGAGLWVNLWGTVEEMKDDKGNKVQKNKAITLSIPGKMQKDAVQYSTKLKWKLSDVPNDTK